MEQDSSEQELSLFRRRREISGAVRAALFIALITIGSYIVIPLPFSPVPIALQSGFVLLAGLILPGRWAVGCVAAYLLLGGLGLPLFAGGTGGVGHLLGPTGGYLIGYLPAVAMTALLTGDSLWRRLLGAAVGSLVIYAVGVPWLALVQGLTPGQALGLGMVPFLAGDALKVVAAALLAESLGSLLYRRRSDA
jgi:biotin transport system substrate-specific component